MELAHAKQVHFVGIGGIGLSAIARVLLARGYRVTGSDPAPSRITGDLAAAGAVIFGKHAAENVQPGTDLVVVTSAVNAENPEVRAAQARGIRVVRRREFLGELTAGYRTVAVAGSHGKTTTTALIGLMLAEAGLDPTVIVGGVVPEFGSNARTGKGDYFVIEADEYDNAFLGLRPYIAVMTNVDYDHPDVFPTRDAYREAFVQLARRVRSDGALLVCGDDAGAAAVASQAQISAVTYGFEGSNLWRAAAVEANDLGGSDFRVVKASAELGQVRLRIPGRHNVLNGLGALAAAAYAGVEFDTARRALANYRGTARRFELRAEVRGIAIVDDYAHHPAEIKATLSAARERFGQRTIWAVFQPHTFTRTKALLDEFAAAFDAADHVVITDVYAAREHDSLGVSGMDIVSRMEHRDARFIAELDNVLNYLSGRLAAGDVLITLGAGDVNRVGERLAGMGDVKGSRT